MIMRNWILFFSLSILTLYSCKPAGVVPPAIRVSLENRDDMISITYVEKDCIIDVYSSKGIGDANVELESTTSIEKLYLRMHLQGLEELILDFDKQSYRIEVQSHGDKMVMQSYRVEEAAEWENIAAADERRIALRRVGADGKPSSDVPLRNGYFELALPVDLWQAESQRTFSIRWIDFYR